MRGGRLALIAGLIALAAAATVVFMVSADEAGAPVHEHQATSAEPARAPINIDARRQQLIGVRTAPAERRHDAVALRAVGMVAFDETRQVEVNAKVDGWIRDLRANYTGIAVRRGERLFTLYSPELLATENEYLLAQAALQQHGQNPTLPETRDHALRLTQAARDRLSLWDISAAEIEALEKRGKALGTTAFLAPRSGVVIEKDAVEGMRVIAGQRLFRIVDLSSVWVEAEVYERDLGLVRLGQPAAVTLGAYPGERFEGRVTYLYPAVAEQTRTLKVRVQLPNRDGRLRPGMYAEVTIATPARDVLTVPADAVLDTGTQQIVFVTTGDGYFDPTPVKIGRRLDGAIEILGGLAEGQVVASGATFFLDSESQLRAALGNYQRRDGEPAGRPTAAGLDISLDTTPDPPRSGRATFRVRVSGPGGRPVEDAQVSAALFMPAMPSMNMPAMRTEASLEAAGRGTYLGAAEIIHAGRWEVIVTVSRDGRQIGSRTFSIVAR